MTRTVRKTICALVIGIFLLVALCALAWATDGFVNWKASSWFNYWGKGSPIVVVENNTAGTPEASAYVGARNVGLTYDSDESTYAVTKYKAPTIDTSFPVSMGSFTDSFGIYIYTIHTGSYSHGTTCSVKVFSQNTTTSPVISKTFTYSAAAPGYGSGGCNHGFCLLSFDEIKSAFQTKGQQLPSYIRVVATNETANSASYLASDSTVKYFKLYDTDYSFSGTTLVVPRLAINTYHSEYQIYAIDNTVLGAETAVALETNLPNSQCNNSSFHQASIVNNSSAVTSDSNNYYVNLALLSFAQTVNEVNTVYIRFAALPSNTSVDGCEMSGFIAPFNAFHFSISQLSAPANLRIEDSALKWDEVEGANGYAVFESNSEESWTVSEPVLDLSDILSGELLFRVRALGNVGASLSSLEPMIMTAFNASNHITQLVALTYDIEGDVVTKFVTQGKAMSEYLYEVDIPGKEFGGWYYDTGYSVAVNAQDKLDKDVTIYARLSDRQVVEPDKSQSSWWELHKWQVLIPCFIVGGLIVLAAAAVAVKKKKH